MLHPGMIGIPEGSGIDPAQALNRRRTDDYGKNGGKTLLCGKLRRSVFRIALRTCFLANG
jgi:hypothetical protein